LDYRLIEKKGNEFISRPLSHALSRYYVSLKAVTTSIDKIKEYRAKPDSDKTKESVQEFLLWLLATCPENDRYSSKMDERKVLAELNKTAKYK
jgi:hypothetical protein